MVFMVAAVVALSAFPLRCLAQVQPPQPFDLGFSDDWDGLDGPWSTFSVRVARSQTFRGVPGLNSPITLFPTKCEVSNNTPPGLVQACMERELFKDQKSDTWNPTGRDAMPSLYFDPPNMTTSLWGVEEIFLESEAMQFPRLANMFVAGVSSPDFFVSIIGLAPGEIASSSDSQSTLLVALSKQGLIPSMSLGYTAGSVGRNKTGSLILGGYDALQVDPRTTLTARMRSDENYSMAVDVTAVGISGYTDRSWKETRFSIDSTISGSTNSTWRPARFVIDSMVPQIWMPTDACKIFEEAFGLSWDADLEFYTINDTTHKQLLEAVPFVTFTITGTLEGEGTRDYTLPYTAFDLVLSPPLVTSDTRYSPLKRSPDGVHILGRAFLQEIYIIVDYEQRNFSISQAVVAGARKILSIHDEPSTPSLNGTQPHGAGHLSVGAYAGVAVGTALAVFFIITLSCAWRKGWWFFREKRAKQDRFDKAELHDNAIPRVEAMEKERAELPANETSLEVAGSHPHPEVEGIHGLHELHSETRTS